MASPDLGQCVLKMFFVGLVCRTGAASQQMLFYIPPEDTKISNERIIVRADSTI
jgi:hypothetical protein